MSAGETLRYLLLPGRPAGLLLVVIFAGGFALALRAGLLGLPLALILGSWFFKYAYVLLDRVAEGDSEPPVLSLEMVNPANEQRPIGQLLIVATFHFAAEALERAAGETAATVLRALGLLALPASVAAFAVTRSFLEALNPLTLWRIARELGFLYVGIALLPLLFALLLRALSEAGAPFVLLTGLALYAWLALFSLIGGGLFANRGALGLEVAPASERLAARDARELERLRERVLDQAWAQARAGNLAGGWQTLEERLGESARPDDEYEWLAERLERLEDPRLADRLVQAWVTRLLNRDNGRALRVAERRLGTNPAFRPRAAVETLRLAELARLAGHRATARALLADFERHFPGDAAADDAAALALRIGRQG